MQDFIPRRVRVNGTRCRLALLQATSPLRPLVPTPVNATDDAGWDSDSNNSTLPLEVPPTDVRTRCLLQQHVCLAM